MKGKRMDAAEVAKHGDATCGGHRGEYAYYVAFFLYIVLAGISHSMLIELSLYGFVELAIQATILVLLVWKLLFQPFSKAQVIVSATLVLFGFIVWRTSAEGLFFWGVLFVVAGRSARLKPLVSMALGASVVVLIAVMGSCLIGLTRDVVILRADGASRHALGFTHPNTLGLSMLKVAVLLVVAQWGKWPIAASLFSLVSVPLVVNFADSRTAAFLTVAAIFLAWLIVVMERVIKTDRWKSMFRYGLLGFFTASLLMSIVAMVAYDVDNPLIKMLDVALSGRPYYAHLYFQEHTPGLFGFAYQNGPFIFTGDSQKGFLVDNAYCSMLLRWGVLATVALCSTYIAFIVKSIRERYWGPCLFGLLIFTIYGLTETYFLAIDSDIYLVAFWVVLYGAPVTTIDNGKGSFSNRKEERTPHEVLRGLIHGGQS